MKIGEIKKIKSGKYTIKIDDKIFTTYDDVLIKNNILYKKNIDISLFEQMQEDHIYYDTYNKTMTFILKRIRSMYEVENFLEKFDISKESKQKIVDHLSKIGLINDERFVNAFISDSVYLKLDGPDKIRNNLYLMQIDNALIENGLEKIEKDIFEINLKKLIDKKLNLKNKYSKFQYQQRIIMEMLNKGYEKNMILSMLDDYEYNDDTQLVNEFNKLYKKLSSKYTNKDLYNKLRQKLYAKGFELNKINDLIIKKEEE